MTIPGRKTLVAGALAAMMLVTGAIAQAAGQKPNVVFILADNVGYGDLGPYGGGELRGYPTPRSDQLAREGLRPHPIFGGAGMTPFACRAHDRTILHSRRTIAHRPTRHAQHAFEQSVHDGAVVQGCGLRDGSFRQVASGRRSAELRALTVSMSFTASAKHIVERCNYRLIDHADALPSGNRRCSGGKGTVDHAAEGGRTAAAREAFTPEVRAEIDNDLTDRSIAFMKQQQAAGKPFFLYLPFSMGHAPSYPSKQFAGKSRIGNYGDKMMEGDYHVGQVLDALKDLKLDDNTIVVFASDNGPAGRPLRELGDLVPDMGSPGPFRGEFGEATEGSIRTFCFIRWPGHVKPNTSSYAMFSEMDFLPTFAAILGAKLPTDRPMDGVDQTAVLLGNSETGARESLLTFIGPDLVALRWKQWRVYYRDMKLTGTGQQMLGGMYPTVPKCTTRRSTTSRWTRMRI